MNRAAVLLGTLLLLGTTGLFACRSTEPPAPENGLTSAVQTPRPPDLGRGAPRVQAQGSYHVFVGAPVRNVCSGTAPYFEFDSSGTRDTDEPTMKTLAECMRSGPLAGKSIKLIGHTDPRGSAGYNERLGLERAEAVKYYLVTQGIDPARVVVESVGKSEASSDPAQWPKDRHVEVELVP